MVLAGPVICLWKLLSDLFMGFWSGISLYVGVRPNLNRKTETTLCADFLIKVEKQLDAKSWVSLLHFRGNTE